jgi:hypothetical protein
MSTSGLGAEPNGPCATRAEVLEAIKALYLSAEDQKKLLGWAWRLSAKFHGKPDDGAAADLLQEAIVRALDPSPSANRELHGANDAAEDDLRRKWYPQKYSFVYFLVGCMMSIASSWKKRDERLQSMQGSESQEAQQELRSPVNPQAQIEASITLAEIRQNFKGDDLALKILELKVMGYTGPEIRERLGITLQDYDAACKRIIRALKSGRWK